jgi:predicted transcriptional regulator
VVKTSIYLDPDVDSALARKAAAKGTTKAALIREALAAAVERDRGVRPRAAGVFEGPGDLARDADRYLEQTSFGET